jgi:hypothetical protein
MGHHEQTDSEKEADAFFAAFADATPEIIERVRAEAGGNLAAVVEEDRAFGYWDRKMAARAARKALRQRAEWAERAQHMSAAAHLRRPDEAARRTPLPDAVTVTLPAPRIVVLTDAERTDTRRWWGRLERGVGIRTLARRIRTEVRESAEEQRRAARAALAWQREQRAFEAAQWHEVVARRNARPSRKIANRWIAIDENRALQIAIAALEKRNPPQGHK